VTRCRGDNKCRDAAALAGYFAALGLHVQTDAVNRLLVLLAVLVIECAGGLALAVGMALGDGTRTSMSQGFAKASEKGTSDATATQQVHQPAWRCETADLNPSPKPRRSARDGLLEMPAKAKGPLWAGQEGLAEALGVTSARVRQLRSVQSRFERHRPAQ
jgi:hypothetical protein